MSVDMSLNLGLNDDSENFYLPGFDINYQGISNSASSLSQPESQPTTKILAKPQSDLKLQPMDLATISDRCRVAIEGKNNMVCIEGHPVKTKNGKK